MWWRGRNPGRAKLTFGIDRVDTTAPEELSLSVLIRPKFLSRSSMFKKIAIAATLALMSASAFAASPSSFYAGGDVSSTSVRGDDTSYTGFGGFAGFRINETFAVEGTLRRVGSDDNIKVNQAAVSMVATGYAAGEWEKVSVFGRIGVNRIDAGHDCNVTATTTVCGNGGLTRAVAGVGIGYDFTPRVTARLEYQKPESHTNLVSLGVLVNF
jgi:OOP family OmpA-OmpF porin